MLVCSTANVPRRLAMARELGSWLNDLGLGKCFETFVANDVDFDLLTELDDGDLERLGISFGHVGACYVPLRS